MTTSKEHSGKVSSGGHWDTERSPARPAGDGECQTEEWHKSQTTEAWTELILIPNKSGEDPDKFLIKAHLHWQSVSDCRLSSAFPKTLFPSHSKGDGQYQWMAKRSWLTGAKVLCKGLSPFYSFTVSLPSSKSNHAVHTIFSHHGTGSAEEVLLKQKTRAFTTFFVLQCWWRSNCGKSIA